MSDQKVVDFNELRNQKLEEKRRKTERILFKNLLGVYCVTGNQEMRPLELIDISAEGCSFILPFGVQKPWSEPQGVDEHGQELKAQFPLRLYFTQDTYIQIHLTIQNARPMIENGERYMRFGCSVDQQVSSYNAFEQFVKFLKAYSEHAHRDQGMTSVFYL
jgi:hypothetical protein